MSDNTTWSSVLERMLESEDSFQAYLSNDSNIYQAYKLCKRLLRVTAEAFDERDQKAAKVTTLQEEVAEQQNSRMRMESALTYVEEQLNTLRATQAAPVPVAPTPPVALTPPIVYPALPTHASSHVASPAPASVVPAPSSDPAPAPLATPSTPITTPSEASEPNARGHRVIKIPDPPIFHGKPGVDQLSYKDWLLKMRNKLRANESYMPTESLKISYIQSLLADNALGQVSARLGKDSTRPFTSAKEILEVLTAGFGNANEVEEARAAYRSLRQGTREFSVFWAKFQRLSQLLDHSDGTLIADLIEKSSPAIQRQLSTGGAQPTNLLELAQRCQRIENQLKMANRAQLIQDRNAERTSRRDNRNNGNNATRQPIVNSSAAVQAPANSNLTSTRMTRISQPRAQLAAPPVRPTNPANTNSTTSRLTTEETDRLMKFGRCFNCKEEGHAARGCTRPARPYSAVSAELQEVTVVEEDASESGKN